MNFSRSGIAPLIILAIVAVSLLVGGGTAAAVMKPGEAKSTVGAAVSAGIPAALAAEPAGPGGMLAAFLAAAVPGGIAYWLKHRAHASTTADLVDATTAHNATLQAIVNPLIEALPSLLTPTKATPPATSQMSEAQMDELRKRIEDAKVKMAQTGQRQTVSVPPPAPQAT